MKSERVFLAQWQVKDLDAEFDIPWPKIHSSVGRDTIRWLQEQDPLSVQIIIEKTKDHRSRASLWAEFFRRDTRREFAVRFAK